MTVLSKEYLLLFNAVTDAERTLFQLRESLLEVQRQAEELFLEEDGGDAPPGDTCPARIGPEGKALTFR